MGLYWSFSDEAVWFYLVLVKNLMEACVLYISSVRDKLRNFRVEK